MKDFSFCLSENICCRLYDLLYLQLKTFSFKFPLKNCSRRSVKRLRKFLTQNEKFIKTVENSKNFTQLKQLNFQQLFRHFLKLDFCKNIHKSLHIIQLLCRLYASKRARKTGSFIHLQPNLIRSNSRFEMRKKLIISASENLSIADLISSSLL